MTGRLDEALRALLIEALPTLFVGTPPAVEAAITSDVFALDPGSVDAAASEPRPDDRTDRLPFDPAQPAGPYRLTQTPDPGPRRVYLTSDLGDRIALSSSEVSFDATDARQFVLSLRAERDLQGINGVLVLYSVTAVFAKLKYGQELVLQLQASDSVVLDRAEALTVAVVALNRQRLLAQARETLQAGDYGAEIETRSLQLLRGTAAGANIRRLHFTAEMELKATRALAADEGRPIVRIRTTSRPSDPLRPVDIHIDVEA
jgi:hypothetical protein